MQLIEMVFSPMRSALSWPENQYLNFQIMVDAYGNGGQTEMEIEFSLSQDNDIFFHEDNEGVVDGKSMLINRPIDLPYAGPLLPEIIVAIKKGASYRQVQNGFAVRATTYWPDGDKWVARHYVELV